MADSQQNGLNKAEPEWPVRSILDTDLYKLTMQQAVLAHFPEAQVHYRFTNRSKNMRFTQKSVEKIRNLIDKLSELSLSQEEEEWLKKTCPYLKPDYLNHLRSYRFKPQEQVKVEFVEDSNHSNGTLSSEPFGQIHIDVQGSWADAILYEVPVMSIVSEVYFTDIDTKWTLRGQRAQARSKGHTLVSSGIRYSEFGTRRRRSFETHKLVIEGLLQGEKDAFDAVPTCSGKLVGTSNVHFARLFGLAPIGTMAHEWTMGIAALGGYDHANLRALQLWDAVYSPPNFVPNSPGHDLTIALTDTFSTRVFWQDLLSSDEGRQIAKRWRGIRQDSGDSKAFARKAKEEYDLLGIDSTTKAIIYSDGLDISRCLDLASYSKQIGIGASFGVGTHLTNDFRRDEDPGDPHDANPDDDQWIRDHENSVKSKPLNIVIKLHSINGRNAVKISDDLTKNTGDAEEVRLCKRRFGIEVGLEDNVEDA